MDYWGTWLIWSLPLYFVLTMRLKGRASAAALWAYLWLIAAFCAATAWRVHQINLAYQRLGPPDPERLAHNAGVLQEGLITTAVALVFPVAFYWWVRRKERGRGGASRTA